MKHVSSVASAIVLAVLLMSTLTVGCSAQQSALDSIATLRQSLKKNPKDLASLLRLGNLYLSIDSTDRATVVFTQATEVAPGESRAWEGLGDSYFKQNIPTMAALQFEKALAIDSIRPDIRYKLARCYIKDQRYGEAGEMYLKLLQQDSTNTSAMSDLGKILFAARQWPNSAYWLGKYVALKPDDKEILPIYLEALYTSQQFPLAKEIAERVLRDDPKHTRALRILADVDFAQNKYQDAIDAYARLRAVDSLKGDDLRQLAKSYMLTSRDSLAANVYVEALAVDSTNGDLLNELGSVYMRMRKYDLAADMFERKFRLDPQALSAYVNYALSSMAQQKWEPARLALTKVTEMKPEYVQGHLFLARCLSQIDSTRGAQREYETVVTLTTGQEEKYRNELAEAHSMIGFALLLEKRYPASIESLNASIKLKDDNPQTRLWRAQAYALSARREDAIKEYKVVLKLDPKNKDAKKGLELLGQ